MAKKTAISPTRAENYAEWYQQVVRSGELAENSSVRGCMVIKPWGYGIWENLQYQLDQRLKALGHENIYCPVFIPLSHMEKEAEHVEGFAKECAVVTHHRLEQDGQGGLKPAGELEEPLIVRPTSETIIGESFSRWVESYRDLPILVNQWANIVRWEMRTRLFLRTCEFLWQEGHTAHVSRDEAMQEASTILDVYHDFVRDSLAMPVIKGEKTESERFPGAENTYCIEAMMQDKKALQAGTSHFLGQNFARAFEIDYLSADGEQEFAWTTSWGVSTRLIGGLIMMHSDDDGLRLPPMVAPLHVVILPILHDDADRQKIMDYCESLAAELRQQVFSGMPLKVKIDYRDKRGGEKAWQWVKKGVPLRIEIGPKECEAGEVSLSRRDKAYRDREKLSREQLINSAVEQLQALQQNLYQQALDYQQQHTHTVESKADFYQFFEQGNGFVWAHWCGDAAIEQQIQQDLGVTIRCLPLEHDGPGVCIFSGKPSAQVAIFARAY